MKHILFFASILMCGLAFTQTSGQECNQIASGIPLVMCSELPNDINVCEEEKTMRFTIENTTTFQAQNILADIAMQLGIEYVVGSVTGATESDISNLSAPVFSVPNIAGGSAPYEITIRFKVNCNVFDNPPATQYRNIITLDYTANSTPSTSTHTSKSFSVQEPALSIIKITNQEYPGAIGDVFQRCVTITNQGLGYLTNFTLTENHGTDIVITGVDLNNITSQSASFMTLNFGAAEIMAGGDSDGVFENGDTLRFCETVRIDACGSTASTYQTSWGCNGDDCQAKQGGGNESANVIFPGTIPNVEPSIESFQVQCLDSNNSHTLKLKNDGLGEAQDFRLDIYTAYGHPSSTANNSFSNGYNQFFDTNTLEVRINGVVQPFTIDSLYISNSTYNDGCGVVNPVQGFVLNLPNLPAGDSLEVDFEIVYCDKEGDCYRDLYDAWAYKYSYRSVCDDQYNVGPNGGDIRTYIRWDAVTDAAPANFQDGETKRVSFLTNGFTFGKFPNNGLSKWIINISKNSCFSLVGGNITVNNQLGTSQWISDYVEEYDSVIVAHFNGPRPFNPDGGNIEFFLQASCSDCPTTTVDPSTEPPCSRPGGASNSTTRIDGSANIDILIQFIPDTNCTQIMDYSCRGFSSEVDCPGCDSGLLVRDYEFIRHTRGNPDVNEDGLPDNNGRADHPEIRLDRAVFGDTVFNRVVGVMHFPAGSQWDLCYARANFNSEMDLLGYLTDTIEVYRNGTKYVSSGIPPSVTPSLTATSGQYLYDISASVLIARGDLPPGFLYRHGDSIVFKGYYKIAKSRNALTSTGSSRIIDGSVSMHVNSDPEPVGDSICHRYYCGDYAMNLTVIPVSHYVHGNGTLITQSCDSIVFSTLPYYSVGDWYTSPGDNLFPREYRNFGVVDTVTYNIPDGFILSRSRFREIRHFQDGGSNKYIWSNNTDNANDAWINVSPIYSDTNKLIYDIESLYDNVNLFRPDESYYSYLEVVLKPTCETPRDVEVVTNLEYVWKAQYGDSAVRPKWTRPMTFRYDAPKMRLQANNPNLFAVNDTIAWTVRVSNVSNISTAHNVWLGDFYENTGVEILRVYDLDSGTLLTNNNGIFEIGEVEDLVEREFMVVADFSNCTKDSVELALGWDCPGYPDSVETYECSPELVTLTVTPRLPEVQTNVTLVSDSIRLCDTAEYVVYMKNVLQGTAYDFNLFGVLPAGVTYLPNSTRVDYPFGSGLVASNDPVNNAGILNWDVSNDVAFITVNGFHGIGDPPNNEMELRFKVLTDCDYASGAKFNFFSSIVANCGDTIQSDVNASTPLVIEDAVPPYETYTEVSLFQITPCSNNAPIIITIANEGPNDFWVTDSVIVELPSNVTYQGNYQSILNGPSAGSFSIRTNAIGKQELTWALPSGLTAGDTTRFAFDVQGNADTLTCQDIPTFNVATTASTSATCVATSVVCNIETITGDSTKNTFVLKSYPTIENLSATSVLNGSAGELVTFDLDLRNTGAEILQGYNSTFEIYHDVDNDMVFTTNDTLVGTYSTTDSIAGFNTLTHFNFDVAVGPGEACGVFVRLDSVNSSCFCESDIAYTDVTLDIQLQDTSLCTDETAVLGSDSINGYLYTWAPSTDIDVATKAQPIFSKNNATISIDSTLLELTLDRVGCMSIDTMLVEVYPLPLVDAGLDDQFCETTTIPLNGNPNLPFESSLWRVLSNATGNPATMVDSSLETNTLNVSGYGIIDVAFIKDNGYCAPQSDTVSFTIFEQSTSTVFDTIFCDLGGITIDDAIATPNLPSLSVRWFTDGGSPIGITAPTNLVTDLTSVPYGESFVYLESINGVCPADTAAMRLNRIEPHTASLPADTMMCETSNLIILGNGPDTDNYERGNWLIDSNFNTSFSLVPLVDSMAQLSGLTYGEQRIIWEITSDYCASAYDTMSLIVYQQSISSVIDSTFCDLQTIQLNTASAFPNVPSLITTWSAYPLSGITFDDSSQVNTNANNIPYGESFIDLVSTNGVCPSDTAEMKIHRIRPYVATLPIDSSVCEDLNIVVTGNSLDSSNLERSFWQIDPTGNSAILAVQDDTIANLSDLIYGETRVIYEVTGDYCPSAYDTMSIFRFEQPTALVDTILLCDQPTAFLNGNMTPPQAIPTWSKNAASTIQFADSNAINTTINFINYGQSEIYLGVVNGVCPVAYDTAIVRNLIPHQAILPSDTSICEPANLLISGNSPSLLNFERGVWHKDSTSNLAITIQSVNDSTALIGGLVYGENRLVWEIESDYCQSDYDTMSIFVFETPEAGVMNDTSICNVRQLPLYSNYYPNNATDYYWSLDQTYNNPNTPTFVYDNTVNPSANRPDVNYNLMTMNIGYYRIVWNVENGVCPVARDTVIIYNNPNPSANYLTAVNEICKNECIEFLDQSTVDAPDILVHYKWYDDDSLVSDEASPEICFFESDTNTMTLIVESDKGCFDTIISPNSVIVHPLPVSSFTFEPTQCIQVDDMIYVEDASENAAYYEYDFGDGFLFTEANPNHYYSDTGIFELSQVVTNIEGCTDTSSYYLYVGIQNTVYIPNAFSPDDNGVNDIFIPVAYGIENFNLQVYNRWGDLLYETDDETKGWDGKLNGKTLKQDVYVWVIKYREVCSDNETDTVIRGHVTLIK